MLDNCPLEDVCNRFKGITQVNSFTHLATPFMHAQLAEGELGQLLADTLYTNISNTEMENDSKPLVNTPVLVLDPWSHYVSHVASSCVVVQRIYVSNCVQQIPVAVRSLTYVLSWWSCLKTLVMLGLNSFCSEHFRWPIMFFCPCVAGVWCFPKCSFFSWGPRDVSTAWFPLRRYMIVRDDFWSCCRSYFHENQ